MAEPNYCSWWASGAARRLLLLSCALAALAAGGPPPIALAEGIVFHVANRCPFPVWPASAPNTGHPVLAGGGFLVPPGKSRRVAAPATWTGRFWARTGCTFSGGRINGAGCLTGDCEGRLACNGSIGTPPATLVEVSLRADGRGSSFDVSLVDGYNLPVAVTAATGGADPSSRCAIAGCAKNVNAMCPPELQVVKAGTGGANGTAVVVACKSACLAFGADAFCCRGAYATPAACRASVYSRMFKDACPAYYSYAYDTDAAAPTGCQAKEYLITFCPSRWGGGDGAVAGAGDAQM